LLTHKAGGLLKPSVIKEEHLHSGDESSVDMHMPITDERHLDTQAREPYMVKGPAKHQERTQ